MYRELLNQFLADNPYMKIAAPASAEEIALAEKKLGLSLPPELKTLLSELNGDNWLIFSTDRIAETTEFVRQGLSECYEDVGSYLFIGDNGCGDYYCYKLDSDGVPDASALYRFEHETGEAIPVAANLSEWIWRYYHDEV